jgi:hypothetical protein
VSPVIRTRLQFDDEGINSWALTSIPSETFLGKYVDVFSSSNTRVPGLVDFSTPPISPCLSMGLLVWCTEFPKIYRRAKFLRHVFARFGNPSRAGLGSPIEGWR